MSDRYPPELAVGVTSSRLAEVSKAARGLHKAILHSFASTGRAPDTAALAAVSEATASGQPFASALAELHEADVVRLDDHGQIRAAYPFSAVPTAHTVAIHGGPTVYAMCAIDALGIAAMLGRDTTIGSADPVSGETIAVVFRRGVPAWEPCSTVVFVGTDTAACAGPRGAVPVDADQVRAVAAADRCCGVMNFFAGSDGAARWMASRPAVTGVVLNQAQALRLGVDIFGKLLQD